MKPLLIFDGDCGFCIHWINRWKSLTKDAVEYAPFQEVAVRFPHIKREAFEKAVHLVEANGQTTRAAHAVFRTLFLGSRCKWLLRIYEKSFLFRKITEAFYRLVAENRIFFSRFLK